MGFSEIIWTFLILSFVLQYLLEGLFKISFIKEVVGSKGMYFNGTDLKRFVSMGFGILFAYMFDFKFVLAMIDTVPNLPGAAEISDYIITGLLLGSGTGFIHDLLNFQKKNRSLIVEAKQLQNEVIKNGNNK